MTSRLPHIVAMIVLHLAAVLACLHAPASAHDPDEGSLTRPACFASSTDDRTLAQMAGASALWNCRGGGWDASAPVSWIRFGISGRSDEAPPSLFFTRISRFASISLTAIDADGAKRTATFGEEDGTPVAAGPIFTLPLPEITAKTRALVVRIVGPHSAPMMTEARLTGSTTRTDWSVIQLLFLAMILGMLVMPLMFDVSFYIVLRERFVLLHAFMAFSMILYVLFAGGLLPVFANVSVPAMAVGGSLSWAAGSAAAAFFLTEFVEPGRLPARMDRALRLAGWWTLLVIGFASLQLSWTQSFDNALYFYGFVPVIAIYLAAIVVALMRGSVAARYVAAAWIPLFLAASERLLRGLGVYAAPSWFDQFLYTALALEVMIVALGVASRYAAIRLERDNARAEAKMLENLSERDPLTGLLNRRALDDRFPDLHAAGYETVALFDLDHFKTVNDTHGHEVGDQVLRVVGDVLRTDPEAVAVRMGGEEFLVLFAGDDVEIRAERMRQTIAVRVAREVEALKSILTASVGLVQGPRSKDGATDFAQLYRRADALLYEAKAGGRNLLASETLRHVRPPPPPVMPLRKSSAA
ncbi:MAG: GGDEF domain-containing protein [Erythrobacter sp.]|nr:GGDEF domain-containing protein [Erythrobacter sp.]